MRDKPLSVGSQPRYNVKETIVKTSKDGYVVTLRKQMSTFFTDELRDSVFYLYESEDAAMASEEYGATGFFVSVSSSSRSPHIYAVTNAHVIADGFPVIRVNT